MLKGWVIMNKQLKFSTSKEGFKVKDVNATQLFKSIENYLEKRNITVYGLNVALTNSINKALDSNKTNFIFTFSKIQFKIEMA